MSRWNFCLAVLALSSWAFATDINPNQRLGSLEILAPDLSGETGFAIDQVQATFTVDNQTKTLTFGEKNSVAAGTGCLSVSWNRSYTYSATQCGIVIQPSTLTTIKLAALKLEWDKSAFVTDFGPRPLFRGASKDADRGLDTRIQPLDVTHQNPILLLPAMTVDLNFIDSNTGLLFTEQIALSENTFTKHKVQPPEMRGTLLLNFVDGAAKLPLLRKDNLVATYRLSPRSYDSSAQVSANFRDHGVGPGGSYDGGYSDYTYNYYKFAEDGVDQAIRAWPLKKDISPCYSVSINEHTIRFNLEPAQTFRVPVATLNIHHYSSNKPGTYQVWSDRIDGSTLKAVGFPVSKTDYNAYDLYTATESSLFVPYGFNYRLDFYILDDFGRLTLQDQVAVDLKSAP